MLLAICYWISLRFGNYLIIGCLTKQWRCCGVLVIFLWIWTCRSSYVVFVSSRQDLFKAGRQKLGQVKTLERVLMPMRVWLQTSEWCLGWPAVGHDSIVEGQESVMIFVFSPAKVRTEWGFCASCLVFTKASRFRCGHKVCGVFWSGSCVLSWPLFLGECGHRSDLARLLNWSWSYKDWVPQLSRDSFIDRISMGLQYGSG